MEYYQPFQCLPHFVYDSKTNKVSIKVAVIVFVQTGESLASRNPVYDPATHSAVQNFDHSRNVTLLAPFNYILLESMIEIISNVNIPYNPADPDGFKLLLRGLFASVYTVKSIVSDKPDASAKGGQVTNTISQSGDIVIL